MSYSDLYIEQKTRPSHILVAIAVIAIGSAVGYFFLSSSTPTRASKQVLKQHQPVNVLPKQVGIFWEVETPDQGWVVYGENPSNLDQISLDERDVAGERETRKYHYVSLKNLEPETTYYYKIISNNELVSAQNNEPFSITTLSSGAPSSSLSPAYGKIVSASGEALSDNLVLLSVTNAYPLLAVTKQKGEWLIPMQYIVNNTDRSSITVSEDTIVNIRIVNETQQSTVKATLSQTHPIPQTIVIGSNYTFIGEDVLSATTKNEQKTTSSTVELQFPKNNSVIPGSSPLIKGKGIPGKTVSIQINSQPGVSISTKVDKDGNWNISVQRSIAPGKYTLSMKTQDSRNKQLEIKRNFTLIKSGEQVLAEASGPATLTPSPSGRPSGTITPTSSAQITEEPTPTDDPSLEFTPTPEPPVSGISMIPYMFAGLGLILLGAGVTLFL